MLKNNMVNKKGQIAIFVIVAIVIVGGILLWAYYSGNLGIGGVPSEVRPAYDLYISCIQQNVKNGIEIAESQGGHVYLEDFVPGSSFAPSSSQLFFVGNRIPYWFYVNGNGALKEEVPTLTEIQSEIARYVQERMGDCDFSQLYSLGYSIEEGTANVKISISDSAVDVSVSQPLTIEKSGTRMIKDTHQTSVKSSLGSLFNMAREIYSKERGSLFLENYTVDALRSYAPVDGVEFNCAPKVWKTQEVVSKLQDGIIANIGAIKYNGNYYSLKNKNENYFVVDLPNGIDNGFAANMLYLKDWPSKVEIYGGGVSQTVMTAQPMGNQQGMGMIGFCYVPYHFVYDIEFPVLIQVYSNDEIFQFPVITVISKNRPVRAASASMDGYTADFDLCADSNQYLDVKFYDNELSPLVVNGSLSYSCFDQRCNLGEFKGSEFIGKVPTCVNGNLVVNAEGYAQKSQTVSTNSESSADVILDREYSMRVKLKLGGNDYTGEAMIAFEGDHSANAVLPGNNIVSLSEGLYNISVFAYSNTTIVIPASTKEICNSVPQTGIFGLFGGTKDQCTSVSLPATKIESGIIGGGKTQTYIFPADLEKGNITLVAPLLPKPSTLEQLQYNFETFDNSPAEVDFV